MSQELNKLTKAQLLALIESGALAPKKAPKVTTTYSFTKPEKSCEVGTPIKASHPQYAKGTTYATWIHKLESGDAIKRRAHNGGSWLLVDSRGLTDEDVKSIALKWSNGRAMKSQNIAPVYVFTVATVTKKVSK